MLEAATVLEARERLARIADGQVSAGVAKKGSARKHIRSLERQASRLSADESKPTTLADLRSIGVEIERVKRG
jgi:hypothetical protein